MQGQREGKDTNVRYSASFKAEKEAIGTGQAASCQITASIPAYIKLAGSPDTLLPLYWRILLQAAKLHQPTKARAASARLCGTAGKPADPLIGTEKGGDAETLTTEYDGTNQRLAGRRGMGIMGQCIHGREGNAPYASWQICRQRTRCGFYPGCMRHGFPFAFIVPMAASFNRKKPVASDCARVLSVPSSFIGKLHPKAGKKAGRKV